MSVAAESHETISLLLIARYALLRESMSHRLAAEPDFDVVAHCSSIVEALEILKRQAIDLVLLELDLEEENAGDFVYSARRQGFKGKVLLLATDVNGEHEAELIRAGVCGIFQKRDSASALGHAIRDVVSGHLWLRQEHLQLALIRGSDHGSQSAHEELTKRQRRVLSLVSDGLKNREIGAQIGVSEGSVKATVQQLFSKFGVRSKSQLVRIALEQNKHGGA